jgi:hypothetical protein
MIELLRVRWDTYYEKSLVCLTDDLYERLCKIYDKYHNKYKANSYVSVEFIELTDRYNQMKAEQCRKKSR